MRNRLNPDAIKIAMRGKGFNAAKLAKSLGVSREAVSQWLKCQKLPRPDKLLKLALLLELDFHKLVAPPENEPVVAFRKRGANQTRQEHIEQAIYMGRMLAPLSAYLPFDEFVSPSTLKLPKFEYDYCKKVARKIRSEIGLDVTTVLDFSHLIDKFNDLQTVLIPVMWGKKEKHENALHVFLPESMTTWIYFNLDTNIHDFKFWMAHELGHVLSPTLREDIGEDFADEFAAALLFPEEIAAKEYKKIFRLPTKATKINAIKKIANKYTISPITIFLQLNKYANNTGLPTIELGNSIYPATTEFNKRFNTLSKEFFGDEYPTPKKYIRAAVSNFKTPFFTALERFLKDSNKSAGYIQTILNISVVDAKGIYLELC